MKIVYVIIAHKNYDQIMRLYKRLDRENVSFVFHISLTSEPRLFERVFDTLKDQPNCYFAKRAFVRWGDAGDVQAALNAIDTICGNRIDYDYAILLSGQCYPIKPYTFICQTLEKNQGKQFVEYIPFSEITRGLAYRIEPYHFWLGNFHFWHPHQGSRHKLLATLFDYLISPFIPKRPPLPQGYTLFKGQLWWTLTRDCVEYIHQHSQSENGKSLFKFLKTTYHAGETYFQTVLLNSKYKDSIVNTDLRYILWAGEANPGHPKYLTATDFNDIANSECLFGRKFDMDQDVEILDLIDENILVLSDS